MPVNPLGGANQPPNTPKAGRAPPPPISHPGDNLDSNLEKTLSQNPNFDKPMSGLDNELGKDPDFKTKFNENLMNSLRTQMDHEKKYHEQQKAWRREMNPDSEK